jgi:hypothetical protein
VGKETTFTALSEFFQDGEAVHDATSVRAADGRFGKSGRRRK